MKNKAFSAIVTLCILAGLCAFGAETKNSGIPDRATYLSDITALLEAQWPKNRTVNIVCHGHSVPAGYFKTPVVDTFNAYPHLLHKELKERFPHAVVNVIVTGIGGETSDRGVERFEKDVLSHNPDIITIDYALNDRRIGLAEAKKSWSEMIIAAKAKGSKVILLTPTGDTRAKMKDPNDPLVKHAEQIRGLAKEHSVALADSLAAFNRYIAEKGDLEDLMSQVNHPNRKGHDLVAEKLMEWFPAGDCW